MERYLAYYSADTICPPKVTAAIQQANASGDYDLPRHKIWIFPTTRPNELMVNATRLSGQDGRMLNVIDPKDFTEAEILGRHQVREYARFLANFVPGCEKSYVVDTGVEAASGGPLHCRLTRLSATTTWSAAVSGTTASAAFPGRSNCTVVTSPSCTGCSTITTTSTEPWCRRRARTSLSRAAAWCGTRGPGLRPRHRTVLRVHGHAAAVAAVISIDDGIPFRDIPGEAVRDIMRTQGSAL